MSVWCFNFLLYTRNVQQCVARRQPSAERYLIFFPPSTNQTSSVNLWCAPPPPPPPRLYSKGADGNCKGNRPSHGKDLPVLCLVIGALEGMSDPLPRAEPGPELGPEPEAMRAGEWEGFLGGDDETSGNRSGDVAPPCPRPTPPPPPPEVSP
jgi:hypothetical protein